MRRIGPHSGIGGTTGTRIDQTAEKPPIQEIPKSKVAKEIAGNEAPTRNADRTRVAAQQQPLPPNLAELDQRIDLQQRIAAVRSGAPGLSGDEKVEIGEVLRGLDQAQLKALRELLVERPPHPQLKQMRGHPALKGPPTAQGVLQILSGEPLGLKPAVSSLMLQRATEAIDAAAPNLSPQDRAAWIDVLSRSDSATLLVRNHGGEALHAISVLGVDKIDAAGHPWIEGRTLVHAGTVLPGGFEELNKYADKVGPQKFQQALHSLGEMGWGSGLSTETSLARLGVEQSLVLAEVAAKNTHGIAALKYLSGSDDTFYASVKGKSRGAIEKMAADAAAKIHSFGANQVPLETGAKWPAMDPPRTQRVRDAERRLALGNHLPPGALSKRESLTDSQKGDLSRGMKALIGARDPALSAQLEQELTGRRFVARRYYDELYEAGVKNPEQRYGIHTYESWRKADNYVREAAIKSRGRPLAENELIQVMQEAHKLAGQGMLDARETHMKPEDLGRIRSHNRDHVQLGDTIQEVDPKVSEMLDKNPYLSSDQIRFGVDQTTGKMTRSVAFAKGGDVPRFVAELDQWVRANEGKIPPHELAAEVHFRLVSIHPFMDGNGRTAKLMVDFLLQRAGIEPPVWRQGDVMANRPNWGQAVREGVDFELATVERYWRVAVEKQPSAGDRSRS